MESEIFSKIDNYISDLFTDNDQHLNATLDSLEKALLPNQSISANQGKFIQILMLANGAKNVLELGTFGGYSTIWIAKALPDNGKVITIESEKLHAEIALKNIDNAGLKHKVDLRIGKALDILPILVADQEGPFDFIFIDADKPPYTEYFDYALKLSRPGTIIIFDNVIREGKILNKNSQDEKVRGVQRLNEALSKNKNVTATILQTVGVKSHDGMAVAVVKR